ncbi:hypothetical protein [uncultured Bacteroides sp.]|uniref:hypothetical protein n=1 Tax=uncultured Bacteroides sp. TaxID=162156 RepID=UPI002603712F|nr:hypothetical protein [uncultured Bacteroides sp.]
MNVFLFLYFSGVVFMFAMLSIASLQIRKETGSWYLICSKIVTILFMAALSWFSIPLLLLLYKLLRKPGDKE